MTVEGISHITFIVRDLDRAVEYYQSLGFVDFPAEPAEPALPLNADEEA